MRNSLRKIFMGIFLAQLLASLCLAQSSLPDSVFERYGGLSLDRLGPTIDAELALKLLRRGNTYSNLERFDEAVEEYRKAISADPNLAEAYRNLANIYLYLAREDEARPILARFISLQRDQPSAALIAAVKTLGEMERSDGSYETALAYDLKAIELQAGNDSQVHIMANSYNNAGHRDKAITVYRAAIAVMPGNAFFDRSLGRLLEQDGQLEAALAAYRSAAAKDPSSDFYPNLVESLERRLQR